MPLIFHVPQPRLPFQPVEAIHLKYELFQGFSLPQPRLPHLLSIAPGSFLRGREKLGPIRGTGAMALANGWRWDRRQRSFVPFTTMEGATAGVCVSFQRCLLHFFQVQAFLTPSCEGLWERGCIKRAGEERRGRASPGMAQLVGSSGEIFRKPPLPLDLVRKDRSRPAGRDSAASPAVRGVQWQLGCGAQPRFSRDRLSPGRVPFVPGSLRTRAVPWGSRRGSVGERSAGLGEGNRGTYSSARRSLSIL